ncbi:ABC-F family ATP-binding cassette domain-containing protein [Limnochorda pilosa]|uniref:Multidrug ABC transporter ATP-binding protein n=1 Tax=Limnochorda pilosa TaxID=1555112 RepID=A0A0K2SNC4_LIMPI|nr:ABC-F family ATP-binding cassette domain-containing protein [Limnochorda pilosa]BAS28324.1 multidrug ABC transporter ATP-binding protein [Limnochorda pilosa]
MVILQAAGLAKYWGAELLFKDVDLMVHEGEKVGLVGRNGSGKTTLLKVLLGRLDPDEGHLSIPSHCRLGYLSQDPELLPGRTVLQEALMAFAVLDELEERLRSLEEQMTAAQGGPEAELQRVLDQYGRLATQYEAAGGYAAETRARTVLTGLGFAEPDLAKTAELLSGGQKVRLGLARLLLEEPDLLLLDEPTNHLDLAATEWLEGYLAQMRSAAIVISHDRYFLDRVTTRTVELEDGHVSHYAGAFSFSREEKRRRQEAALEAFKRNQAERERLRQFYEKWRSTPNRKGQAMSRKKRLEKMAVLQPPKTRSKRMRLAFRMEEPSGREVLTLQDVAMAFGSRSLFAGVHLRVFRGDRVALVGPNGAGKTTLLKILHGLLQPSAGTVWWGAGVRRGYFSQDLDALDPGRTCLEEMLEIPGYTRYDAQSLLGRFLFSGEDAGKQIAQCSGGERNRLILAKLTASDANVLLLDEPTNHLDLDSKEVLEEALREYPGTILFVSHDRFFVDQVATKVWEFGPDGIHPYEGNYTAYRAQKERLREIQALREAAPQPQPRAHAQATRPQRQPASRRDGRQKGRQDLQALESRIQELEGRKAELEERLADPQAYREGAGRELTLEYRAVAGELDRLYDQWAEAVE